MKGHFLRPCHRISNLERFEEETLNKIDNEIKEAKICEYNEICPLHKYSMKCIFNKKECRSYIFYERYKEFDYGRQLGI